MPIFNLYSAADIGLSDTFANFFASPSSTVAASIAPDTLELSDDDLFLEDEGGSSDQILTEDLYIDGAIVGTIGQIVTNLGQSTITNATTGETGLLVVIQVDGVAVGYATTIDLNPGDSISTSAWAGTPTTIEYDALEVSCFTRGTNIKTRSGEVPIENLEIGDQVWTRDRGFQPIRWIGAQISAPDARFAPIMFKAGALANSTDLCVSPMHRMLLDGWRAELLFGQPEILVHARDLINDITIFARPAAPTEYFHLLFDHHEIIRSNGCLSESFHPFRADLTSFGTATRAELLALFPCLSIDFPDARPTLTSAESMLLQNI